jgi:hypothetical protein
VPLSARSLVSTSSFHAQRFALSLWPALSLILPLVLLSHIFVPHIYGVINQTFYYLMQFSVRIQLRASLFLLLFYTFISPFTFYASVISLIYPPRFHPSSCEF